VLLALEAVALNIFQAGYLGKKVFERLTDFTAVVD